MLNEQRLIDKFKAAMNEQNENDDALAARDRLAKSMAKAIIEEIKELKIVYSSGLASPSGPVTGQIIHIVQ